MKNDSTCRPSVSDATPSPLSTSQWNCGGGWILKLLVFTDDAVAIFVEALIFQIQITTNDRTTSADHPKIYGDTLRVLGFESAAVPEGLRSSCLDWSDQADKTADNQEPFHV